MKFWVRRLARKTQIKPRFLNSQIKSMLIVLPIWLPGGVVQENFVLEGRTTNAQY